MKVHLKRHGEQKVALDGSKVGGGNATGMGSRVTGDLDGSIPGPDDGQGGLTAAGLVNNLISVGFFLRKKARRSRDTANNNRHIPELSVCRKGTFYNDP